MGIQKTELPGLWFLYSRGSEIVQWPYDLPTALAKPELVALWVDYCVVGVGLSRNLLTDAEARADAQELTQKMWTQI